MKEILTLIQLMFVLLGGMFALQMISLTILYNKLQKMKGDKQ